MTLPPWVKAVAALLAATAIVVLGVQWGGAIGRNAVLAASEASTRHSLDSLRTVAQAVDTIYRTETVTLRRVDTAYVRLRDTLNVHDTIQVKVFVERADSVVKACSLLQLTCAERHTVDSATAAGWQQMYRAERAARPAALLTVGKLAVAALAGFGAGRIVK